MATIQSSIELEDNFSNVLNNIVNAVNMSVSAIEEMQDTMNAEINPSSLQGVRNEIDQATIGLQNMAAQSASTGASIDLNTSKQKEFNYEIENGVNQAGNLKTGIMGAVTAFGGLATMKKAVGWIEDCTSAFDEQMNAENQLAVVLANMLDQDYVAQFEVDVEANTGNAIDEINAIQNQIDDNVVVNVSAETQALQSEFNQIRDKANEISEAGIYTGTAMTAAAAEFATYFSDVDAITLMMDTLSDYAMGMTGGGALDTQSLVDYATNLGKVMSGSYDAMTKKGFEFSDVQKDIIEGVATEQEIIEALGEEYLSMSSDMQAAAAITQVIEDSWAGLYSTMSNTPEGKIIQMNNAFGNLKQTIGGELYPYVLLFIDAINDNWSVIEGFVNGFAAGLEMIMGVLSTLVDMAFSFGAVIQDNWGIIEPIIMGVVAAMGAYVAYLAVTKAAEIASAAVKGAMCIAAYAHAAATGAEVSAEVAATAAQYGFNTALLACPLTWIVVGLIAIVAAVVAVTNQIAKMTDVASSGFGVIGGCIFVVGAAFQNLGMLVADIALGIGSAIFALASNLQTAFGNAIAGVQAWFYNLLSTALNVIGQIAAKLNELPFVSFDFSGITSMADEYAGKAAEASASKGEYVSISDAFSSGFSTYDAFSSGWASEAFKSGSSWGDSVADSVSSGLSDLFNVDDITTAEDYLAGYSSSGSAADGLGGIGDTLDNIAGNTGSTAGSVADIANHLDVTDEELKYLRDIAEQETINRFTLATVNIDQSGMTNNVSGQMDLDGIVSGITEAVDEAIDIMTDGVHE